MGGTEGRQSASWSQTLKTIRSPDWSLQLDSMKSESLVIANQNVAVNTFSGLVHTARHVMGVCCTRSGLPNLREDGPHGMIRDWDEVVTR